MFKTDRFLIIDGGMGTMLQSKGMEAGEKPELFILDNPEALLSVHKAYVEAGANIITACTFGASKIKLGDEALSEKVILTAVDAAKKSGAEYVALDIGPCGGLLEPIGSVSFEEAYDAFACQVKAGVKAGADLIIIETMSDLLEIKAAVLAAKENSDLPVIATMTFEADGKTFLGTDAVTAAIALSSFGADAAGVNCSLGPDELSSVIDTFTEYSDIPVVIQPNAGLPAIEDGKTVYKITPEDFAKSCAKKAEKGVCVFGGCCGTTPDHIRALCRELESYKKVELAPVEFTAFTGGRQSVVLNGENSAVIGERINPTGKKMLKQALKAQDYDYVINEALNQENAGADILDVNAGLPEIDEKATLVSMIKEIQAVCALPLQIDSSDPDVIESAVRIYSGKPIINSVNGTEESMSAVLPIVKKYGTAVVALTLDENGIPQTAEGRLKIAEKIVDRAEKMGINRKNILVDCLVLTVSTNQSMVTQTIKAVSLVKEKLGVKTVLGVSNVSFGMPQRELINAAFLAEAYGAGLDMPILNPMNERYREIVMAHKVINNEDISGADFIEKFSQDENKPAENKEQNKVRDLKQIIISGLKGEAKEKVKSMLETAKPLDIINEYFIPALDIVGENFEKGKMFLPQLMASAQAVKNGFEAISESMGSTSHSKGKIVLATVKGDIHDIGKNIVKMLLENYGYRVIDLGKDVEPEKVVEAVIDNRVKVVGLSALMTATVKAMQDTIEALRQAGADCKVMVGGAVLNEEYAEMVGADYYVSDAMSSARVAAEVLAND